MTTREPTTEVDSRFGDEGVGPIPWAEGRQVLETAGQYWISSVRSDGRPHVTPLVGVWHEDAMYFATGPDEQKARNVVSHPQVVLTTGTNDYAHGLDVVVEGEAVRVTDDADLRRVARATWPSTAPCGTSTSWTGRSATTPSRSAPTTSAGPRLPGGAHQGARLRQGLVQPDPLALHRLTAAAPGIDRRLRQMLGRMKPWSYLVGPAGAITRTLSVR